jgi:hypothetical protein
MKNVKQVKAIFCAAVILLLLSGCKDKSSLLIGTWKLKDIQYATPIPPGMKAVFDKYVDDMRKSFKLTYNADGTFNSTAMNGQALQGKWKLNWNSSSISVVTDNGQKKDYAVLELSHDAYSFKMNEKGQEMTFIMVSAN